VGDKSATQYPVEYIKKNWGDNVKCMSPEELQVEVSQMLLLRKMCTKMANEDLSMFTSAMATILNVKQTVNGSDHPVLDCKDWIQSLSEDCSEVQLQKWIFAWMFVRANYNKFVSKIRSPEEMFETQFMEKYHLQYDKECIQKMKKNTKTCVRLLYNVRARSWRDKMINQIKGKLQINITLKTPKNIRGEDKGYRREPNTFFIGNVINGDTIWKEVRILFVIHVLFNAIHFKTCLTIPPH